MQTRSHADHDIDRYAAFHGVAQAHDDEVDRIEQEVRAEIAEVFTVSARKVAAARLTLPGSDGHKETSERFDYAALTSDSDPAQAALLHVLQRSDCPHVAAWRQAMAHEYAERTARDVAYCRAGVL